MGKKGMNRREFFGRAGMGILSTGIGLPLIQSNCTKKSGDKLITRTLGRTGLEIPIVSFGVMNTHSDALIRAAIDAGINHLDTAHGYLNGNSEIAIGRVLKESGLRDKVTVATKIYLARDREKAVFSTTEGPAERLATEENFENQLNVSLDRLQSDYVDVLYLHSLYSPEMATFEPMMKALTKAKESGKARFIGVTTHRNVPEVMRASVDLGVAEVIEISYNFMDQRKEAIRSANQYAAEHDVGIVAMKVMGGNRADQDESMQVNHKAALKWVLNDENVTTTIPGMTTFDQLALNLSVMEDLKLTPEEERDLTLTSMLPNKLYCQNCRSCIETCPHRVEVPNLVRSYMYAKGYGNQYQAKTKLSELPVGKGLDVCRDCSNCIVKCANGMQVADRVKSLVDMRLV